MSADFDYSSAEFSELFCEADVSAFQHPAWQQAMQAYLRKQSSLEERTLVLRCKESHQLVGVLPLVARKKMGATLLEYANCGLVDYALPTLHRNFWQWVPDAATLSMKLDAVLGRYDMLRIKHMPTNDPAFLRLFPNSYMERASFSAHAVELGSDYDAWRLTAISKAERKSRDKKRRAMMRNGDWQMHRLSDPDEITDAFRYLRLFHKDRFATRPGTDMIQEADAFDFYVDLARNQAATGYARTYRFTYDGQTVAVQFGLSFGDRYLYLIMGVDYDQMGRYSPGLLMTEDIIRDCIKGGTRVFDLTVGDEPYKAKFGTKALPIYTLWHAHSMLGTMGRTVADIMQKRKAAGGLRRWMST